MFSIYVVWVWMMKQLKQALMLAVLSGSAFFAAATEFEVPSAYEILVVNGAQAGNVFFKNDRRITLPDSGKQQVVLRFAAQRGVVNTEDMRGIAKSQPIVLTFSTDGLTHITLEKSHLYTAKAVDEFAKKPVIALVDQAGNPVTVVQDVLFKEGVQVNRDFEQEVQAYNQSNGVAAVALTSGAVSVVTPVAANSAIKVTKDKGGKSTAAASPQQQNASAIEQAKLAFDALTEAEKKAFLQWAVGKM